MKHFLAGMLETGVVVPEGQDVASDDSAFMESVISFADAHRVALTFGTANDGRLLCQYDIRGNTMAYCKGVYSELQHTLKQHFRKLKALSQSQGDVAG